MGSSSKTIKNFYSHRMTGKTDDSFIGLKIIGNNIHFHYPESYRFDESSSTVRHDIIDLLRTISIAKTSSEKISQVNNKRNQGGDFALMSYLWVIKDYLANGFYVNREKIYKVNESGRVDWKRTMQSQPIVSRGSIIYPNITVSVKNNVDNILVEIHKYCVKKSLDFIGWLFNLNSKAIETKPFNPTVKKLYIATLQKELDRTFDDDKRIRLRHLYNVIEGLDARENDKEFVYGVDTYYYIFERMIDSIFGNIKDLKGFNPKAEWKLVRSEKPIESSPLRPDTIIVKGSTVYILDSKFYRFGYTGDAVHDLPEITSIQKQITYGDFIKKNVTKIKVEQIYNAFLIPFDKEREVFRSDDNIQYVGYAKSSWKDNDKSHELIHTFLIDLKHVVRTWNRFNHDEDVNYLIQEIEKHNAEVKDCIK